MRKITDLLLRFLARDLQAILDFIGRLDALLDSYIATRDAEIADLNNQIAGLEAARSDALKSRSLATNLQGGVQNLRG